MKKVYLNIHLGSIVRIYLRRMIGCTRTTKSNSKLETDFGTHLKIDDLNY